MAKEGLLAASARVIAMRSKTKEEAFLQGVLYGFGAHNACAIPNWDLVKEYPESINAEREIRDIFEEVHKKEIAEATRLLELERAKNES